MSLLNAKQVAYNYPQNNRGVDPVSLQVDAGETLLIRGPSGCGKSTLARCLTGFVPHLYVGELHGKVVVNGLDTAVTPLWQLSEEVGLLFPKPHQPNAYRQRGKRDSVWLGKHGAIP